MEIKVPFLKQPTGLGDAVAAGTTVIGVKPCGGCKQRQAQWNKVRLVPYRLPIPEGQQLRAQGQRDQQTQILLTQEGSTWATMEFAKGKIANERPFENESVARADFAQRMTGANG